MLCLTRKLNEVIEAGELTIHVLGIKRGSVMLGLDAPQSMRIIRPELKTPREDKAGE